jgi:hypothetical protein
VKHLRSYLVAGLAVLAVGGLLLPLSGAERSPSSFGSTPTGIRGLHDLLDELGLSAGRSLEPVARLPEGATVWWIAPDGVCDSRIAAAGGVDILDPEAVTWPARAWIEAGGTAVVFLDANEPGRIPCDAIAGIGLPERKPSRGRPGSQRVAGGTQSDPPPADAEGEAGGETETVVVSGPLTPSPRRLSVDGIMAFEETLDWSEAASVSASPPRGESGDTELASPVAHVGAFVLEREWGAGRLVVVADARFTRNQWLDSQDAAPLAVDLVRHYGIPWFDEREHGFLSETSAVRYLASSPAWPVFAGLLLLGVLFAWWGTALPARSVEEFDPETPTLATFVDSMAALYSRSRDHSRLLERYRQLTAARLRRHFGVSPEVPVAALVERIERDRQVALGALKILTDRRRVDGAKELAAAARELDELVREVTR